MADERRIPDEEREIEPTPPEQDVEDDVELHGGGPKKGGTITSPVEGPLPG